MDIVATTLHTAHLSVRLSVSRAHQLELKLCGLFGQTERLQFHDGVANREVLLRPIFVIVESEAASRA
jgi:hypothetical protein